jgi:hypothetical protein
MTPHRNSQLDTTYGDEDTNIRERRSLGNHLFSAEHIAAQQEMNSRASTACVYDICIQRRSKGRI